MTSPIAVPLIIGSKSLKKSEKSVRCLWPWVKFKFEDKIPALTLTATAASTPLTMLAAPTPADIAPTFAYVGSTIIATGTNFISGSWMHCQSGRDRQLPHCSRVVHVRERHHGCCCDWSKPAHRRVVCGVHVRTQTPLLLLLPPPRRRR